MSVAEKMALFQAARESGRPALAVLAKRSGTRVSENGLSGTSISDSISMISAQTKAMVWWVARSDGSRNTWWMTIRFLSPDKLTMSTLLRGPAFLSPELRAVFGAARPPVPVNLPRYPPWRNTSARPANYPVIQSPHSAHMAGAIPSLCGIAGDRLNLGDGSKSRFGSTSPLVAVGFPWAGCCRSPCIPIPLASVC